MKAATKLAGAALRSASQLYRSDPSPRNHARVHAAIDEWQARVGAEIDAVFRRAEERLNAMRDRHDNRPTDPTP